MLKIIYFCFKVTNNYLIKIDFYLIVLYYLLIVKYLLIRLITLSALNRNLTLKSYIRTNYKLLI